MPDVPNVPNDLIKLTDVLVRYKPRRGWWQVRMDKGEIQPYYVPGERGIWLSRADVERLIAPRPYDGAGSPGQQDGQRE